MVHTLGYRLSRGMAALLLLALVACSDHEAAPSSASVAASAAATPETYLVGTAAIYEPYEFRGEQRRISGFTIDILNAVAAKGGFKVRYVDTPWEDIFTTLPDGDRDLLASSVTITPARKASMAFSEPYFEARQVLVATLSHPVPASPQALAGKRIGVQAGTSAEAAVRQLIGRHGGRLLRFATVPQALQALESGRVEVVLADNGVVRHYLLTHPVKLTVTDASGDVPPELYGFVVRKGNQAVLDRLNKGLEAIKADGSYARIYQQYFGASAPSKSQG